MNRTKIFIVSLAVFVLISVGFAVSMLFLKQEDPPRFANLPTPTGMSGTAIYAQRCSTCHGDRGQGLTPEWRTTWPESHQTCSKSKCHGRDHPPDGFYLPNNYSPAVIGPQALTRFENAATLYAYVSAAMPFSAPGDLSSDEYWRVTNFMLWANGVIDVPNGVNSENAEQILLARRPFALPTVQPATPVPLPIMPGMDKNSTRRVSP